MKKRMRMCRRRISLPSLPRCLSDFIPSWIDHPPHSDPPASAPALALFLNLLLVMLFLKDPLLFLFLIFFSYFYPGSGLYPAPTFPPVNAVS